MGKQLKSPVEPHWSPSKSFRHNNPLFGHLTVRVITQMSHQPCVHDPQIAFILLGSISKDLSKIKIKKWLRCHNEVFQISTVNEWCAQVLSWICWVDYYISTSMKKTMKLQMKQLIRWCSSSENKQTKKLFFLSLPVNQMAQLTLRIFLVWLLQLQLDLYNRFLLANEDIEV